MNLTPKSRVTGIRWHKHGTPGYEKVAPAEPFPELRRDVVRFPAEGPQTEDRIYT